MIDRFRVVPAAYVIFRREGTAGPQVLLQLREGTGYMDGHWACAAAGHVEAGEPVQATARRETREELGVEIEPADLVPLCAMHRTSGREWNDERVDFFFECRAWAGEPALREPDKAADLRWFGLDDLPRPVVPHERFVLDRLARGTLDPIVSFGFEPAVDAAPQRPA